MVERQQVLDLEVGTPNFSNHYVLTWLSPTRVWREGVGGAEEDFLILLTTFWDTLLMCCLLVRSFHIWIQEHGRPTAVQAFGIGILKLLWAHILSSHIATCTCTCSSNLCSNPVASYKTLWIIPVTFPLTVGVHWCWIYAVSFSHSTDGSPSAQHYPSQSIPTNQLQSQLQQHFADLAAKTPLPELLGKVQNLGFPSSCTFVLNMLERWVFGIHLFCFSKWSKNFPTK